jgi:hypothetical protein
MRKNNNFPKKCFIYLYCLYFSLKFRVIYMLKQFVAMAQFIMEPLVLVIRIFNLIISILILFILKHAVALHLIKM